MTEWEYRWGTLERATAEPVWYAWHKVAAGTPELWSSESAVLIEFREVKKDG